MRTARLPVVLISLIVFSCAGRTPEPIAKLRGQLELSVDPNPIVATPLGNDLYELKFDIVMREAGGVGVRIEDFTVKNVVARGRFNLKKYP